MGIKLQLMAITGHLMTIDGNYVAINAYYKPLMAIQWQLNCYLIANKLQLIAISIHEWQFNNY